jgi:hypothetical protein
MRRNQPRRWELELQTQHLKENLGHPQLASANLVG